MKDAAKLVIDRPGAFVVGKHGHREFIRWLRDLTKRLEKHPEQFEDKGQFKATYYFK